jgi:hypothetical protein
MKAFSKNFKFVIDSSHDKFIGAYEKKLQVPTVDGTSVVNTDFKYIPARKFFSSLIILSCDTPADKAE